MFATTTTTTSSEPREEDLHSRPTSTLPVPLPSSSSSSSKNTNNNNNAPNSNSTTSTNHNNNNNNNGGILFTGGSRSGMYLSINHQRRPDDRLILSWCTSSPRLLVPYPHDPSTMKFEDHPTQDMLDDYATEMLSKAFASASLRTLLSVRRLANTTPLPVFVELVDATTTMVTATISSNNICNSHEGQTESRDEDQQQHEYSYMHVALFLSTLKALQPALASSRNSAIRINFMGCTFRNCHLTDRDVATFLNGLNGTLDMWSSSLMNKNTASSTSSAFTIGCWPVHALDGNIPTTIEFSFCENPNISATSFPQLIKGVAHFVSTLAPPETHVKRALHLVMFFTSVKNAFSQENNSINNNSNNPKTRCVQVAKATSDLWCQKTGLCIDVNFLSDDPYSFSLDRDGSVGVGSVGNNYAASCHAGSCDRSYSCLSYMSGGSVIDERIFSDPSVILAAKKQKVMLLQQHEQQQQKQQQKEKEGNFNHYENINNNHNNSNDDDNENDCSEDSRTASPMPIAPALVSSSSKNANKNNKTNNNIFPKPAPPKTSTPIRGSAPIPPQSSIQLVQQKQQTRDDNYDGNKTPKNVNDDQKFSASISFFSLYELLSRNMNIYIQEASERGQLVSQWCQEVTKYFEFENDNNNNNFGMTPEIKESLLLHHNLLTSLRYNIFSHNNNISNNNNNPIPLLRCEDFDDVILPLLSQCAASVIQNHAIVRPNHLRQVMQNIKQFLVKDKWCGWNYSLVESNSNSSNLNNNCNNNNNINLSEICSEIFSLWSQTGGNSSVVVDRAFDAAEKILVEVDPWLNVVDSKMMKLLQESYGLVEVHFAFTHTKMLLIAKEEKTRKMKLLKEQQQQQQQLLAEEEKKKREAEDRELLRQRQEQENEDRKRAERKVIESNTNSNRVVKIKEPKPQQQQLHRERTVENDDGEIKPRSYAKKSVSIEQQQQTQQQRNGNHRKEEQIMDSKNDDDHETEYYPPQKIPHREYKQAKPLPPWGSAFAATSSSTSNNNNNNNNSSRSTSCNSHQNQQQDENSQPRKKRELTKPSVREIMEQYTKANQEAEIKRRQQKKQLQNNNNNNNNSVSNNNNSSVSQSNSRRSSSAVSNNAEMTTMKPDWIEVNSNGGRVPTLREKDEKSKKEDAARQELETRQHEYMEERRRKSELVKQKMYVNESNNIHPEESFSSSPVPSSSQQQQLPQKTSLSHSAKNEEKSRAPTQLQSLRDGWKKSKNCVASPPLENHQNDENEEEEEEQGETETSCIVNQNNNNFSSPCDLYERSPIPNVPSAKKSKSSNIKNDVKSNNNEKTLSSIESLLSQALLSAAKNDPNLIDSAVSPRRLLKALLKATNGESTNNNNNHKNEPSTDAQLRLDSSSPIHHRHPSIANVVNGLVWNNGNNNQNGGVDNNNYYFTPPRFTSRQQQQQQLLPQSSFHYHNNNNSYYYSQQHSSNNMMNQNKSSHQFREAENHYNNNNEHDNFLSFAQQFELTKKLRENNISGERDVMCSPVTHDAKISQPPFSSCNHNHKSAIIMSRPLTNLQNFTNRDRIIYHQQQHGSVNNQKNIIPSASSSVWDSMFHQVVDTESNHDQRRLQHPPKQNQTCSGTFLHQHFAGQASYGDTTNEMLKKIRNFGTNAERQHYAVAEREKRFDPFLGTAQRQQDEELERDSLQLHNEILEHLQRVTPGLKEEAEKRARALFSGI